MKVFPKMCRALPFNLQAIIQQPVIGSRAERGVKKKSTVEKGKKKMKSILADEFLSLFKLALNQVEKCPRYPNRGKRGLCSKAAFF